MNGSRIACCLPVLLACLLTACAAPRATRSTVYVSGYGGEITAFDFDAGSGALRERARVKAGVAPSYLAFRPDARFAYAIDEARSEVIAFAIDARDGSLRELTRAASGGAGPAHLAVHPSGKWLAVAHYGGGETTILSLAADGRIGEITATSKGPSGACKHAHQAVFTRAGSRLFVPCLGSDYVLSFTFTGGSLTPGAPPSFPVPGGPRHLAFDPSERRVYILSEHASTITSFEVDPTTGAWTKPVVVRSYERQPGASAHIQFHPSAPFVYASNRSENSLAVILTDPPRPPRPVSFVTAGLASPRHFTVHPSGEWLLVANQTGSQDLMVFEINPTTGTLTHRATAAVGREPSFVGVIVLP